MLGKNLCVVYHDPVSPEWFQQTIEMLSRYYNFKSAGDLEEYYYGNKKLKNSCHITFDDGCRSVFDFAYPILKEKGIPATLYVSPEVLQKQGLYWFQKIQQVPKESLKEILKDNISEKAAEFHPGIALKTLQHQEVDSIIDKAEKYIDTSIKPNITIEELLELHHSDIFEIGAHTINHPILHNETDEQSEYEISQSIKDLEKILQGKVNYFAYPNGKKGLDYDERELKILKQNDIKLAFTTKHSFFNKNDHPYEIPRIDVSNGSSTKITIKSLLLPYFQETLELMKSSSEINQRKAIMKTE